MPRSVRKTRWLVVGEPGIEARVSTPGWRWSPRAAPDADVPADPPTVGAPGIEEYVVSLWPCWLRACVLAVPAAPAASSVISASGPAVAPLTSSVATPP